MTRDKVTAKATITIEERNETRDGPNGPVTRRWVLHNMYMDTGFSLWVSGLAGIDCKIRYMAFGDGTTAETGTQTTLMNELGRVPLSNQTAGAVGEYITRTYVGPNDGNFTWEELGWFAGSSSQDWNNGTGKDTGIMLGRKLFHYVKTSGMSITITRSDKLTRA